MLAEETTPRSGNTPPPTMQLLRVLRRRLWVIMMVAIVAAGSAVGFSLLQTPQYESTVRMLIGEKAKTDRSSVSGDVQGLQQLTATMAEAVRSIPVAEAVIDQLDLKTTRTPEGLRGDMSARQQSGTMLMDVSVRDTDPKQAQQIADTVGQVFENQVSEISPGAMTPGANTITATVLEPAQLPHTPISPNPLRNGGLGLLLGILLGIGLAFLLEYREDKWNSPEEVEQVSGVPAFGIIPTFEK